MKNADSRSRKEIFRILDANGNRAREGVRVCEDIARFIWNSKPLSDELRKVRHGISRGIKSLPYTELLDARDTVADVGKPFNLLEKKRTDWKDVFIANAQRAKEALRVLEEVGKLADEECASRFKRCRYMLYAAEKRSSKKL